MRYQAFGLPRQNHDKVRNTFTGSMRSRHHPFEDYILDDDISGDGDSQDDLDTSQKTNNLSVLSSSAFESAAKKAAKERKNKSLVTEIAVSFHLPTSLANVESREEQSTSGNTENTTDDDTTTVMLSRRIPILAKFSPMVNGVRYLALQYTPT